MIGKKAGIKEEFPEEDLTDFGITWWGKEWIQSMLSAGRHFRMQRGIIYARDNRVSDIIINKGEIFAQCQGTAPVPYRIKIKFQILNDSQWGSIIENMSQNLLYESSLFFGEMPEEIKNVFKKSSANLFPEVGKTLDAECSCPDKAIPCKHIAALILTLAKVFDYDPLLLLKLRGKEKGELFEAINSQLYKPKSEGEQETLKVEKKTEKKTKKTKQIEKTLKNEEEVSIQNKSVLPSITFNIEDFKEKNDILSVFQKSSLALEINRKKDFPESLMKIYKTSSAYIKELMYKTEE